MENVEKNSIPNQEIHQEGKFLLITEKIFEGTPYEDEIEIPVDKKWINRVKKKRRS